MGTLGGIPLEVGDVLAKKYRLDGLIGEGGTGLVVAARHLQLDQPVAIKFLRTALSNEEIRLRFEREARAIEKLTNDHVVLLYDVGTLDDGEPFMVMEYLEGRDLARVLKEESKLPIADAVDCMLQVCEALAEAHAMGIVHRDLKPANLFLTRASDGAPFIKVVDFGISKFLDERLFSDESKQGPLEVTNAFTVLGSPRFMAPEQLRSSKDVDHRADLWSVGAVLFQLLSGRHAFNAETNVQASLRVLTAEPEDLCACAPHVPRELGAIVARCLVKDREARWQSAAELGAALAPFASERTREGLEVAREARSATRIAVAMSVAGPPSSEREERGPPSGGTTVMTVPKLRVPTPRTPIAPVSLGGTVPLAMMSPYRPVPPTSAGPPSAPISQPLSSQFVPPAVVMGPPSTATPSVPAPGRRFPSVAIVLSAVGLAAVLLGLVALTMVRRVATPRAPRAATSAIVPLDAGPASP